ncbi:MAG: xanthine dehydrogenase small subunit [Thiolinea sp.]
MQKTGITQDSKNTITFILDGQPVTPPPLPPDTTLLNYLRDHLDRKGSKEGCAEGDCGACTVVIADLHHGESRYRAVNACIQFLPTLDGKVLYTVESLQQGHELHPVQQAMFDCHASQCGFCTPGFVMSLFALYKTQSSADRQQVSTALSGNLCRCTGYRPILEAGQRMYEYRPADAADTATEEAAIIQQLQDLQATQQSLTLNNNGQRFFAPTTTAELAELYEQYPDATILAGGTDVGLWVTKQFRDLPNLIYLGKVTELDYVRSNESKTHLEIGALATLEDGYRELVKHYPELTDLHERFASPPIRNAGTLVGNVANGSPIGDSMPALIALGSSVVLRKGAKQRELAMEDFYLDYQKKDLQAGEFVEAVRVPLPQTGQTVRCWKISKRFEQDISAVCAAFWLTLDEKNIVENIRICYGGMAAIPKRATQTENHLRGQTWNQTTVEQAMQVIDQDFTPLTDMRASSDYRMKVAKNLLLKFYLETEA